MSQMQTQTQTQRDSDNTYAQAGNIESVSMTNFMCHANLEIELCPGVNFIVGENGSGKSAILTALCVALVCALRVLRVPPPRAAARQAGAVLADCLRRCQGARASKTNRSESGNKGLVKTGANIAKLVVRMRNQGPEAYRPEDFGHTIVVERTISATVRLPPPAGRRFQATNGALCPRRARGCPRANARSRVRAHG